MISLHAVWEKQYWNVIQSQHLHTDPGDRREFPHFPPRHNASSERKSCEISRGFKDCFHQALEYAAVSKDMYCAIALRSSIARGDHSIR